MPENVFSPKMATKSKVELRSIILNTDYTLEARHAAQWELETRHGDDSASIEKLSEPILTGEEQYASFTKSIKKKSVWAFTPKYTESLKPGFSSVLTLGLAKEVLEKLQWDIIHYDYEQIIARRPKSSMMGPESEQISIKTQDDGFTVIESRSTGSEIFDAGRNSKRVKLFIHVFNEIVNSKSEQELQQLEDSLTKTQNWDDYIIPEKLPAPKNIKAPNPALFFFLTTLGTLLITFVFSIMVLEFHIIVLYESLVAWVISFVIVKSIKFTNYTHWQSINYLVIGIAVFTVLASQYFQFEILRYRYSELAEFDFLTFMKVRFQEGFILKSINLDWYGWIGLFVLQFVIINFLNMLFTFSGLIKYVSNRVPDEVTEFAMYHLVKGKNFDAIRIELSSKGWTKSSDQDYVFHAVDAAQEAAEFTKNS